MSTGNQQSNHALKKYRFLIIAITLLTIIILIVLLSLIGKKQGNEVRNQMLMSEQSLIYRNQYGLEIAPMGFVDFNFIEDYD